MKMEPAMEGDSPYLHNLLYLRSNGKGGKRRIYDTYEIAES